MKTLLAALAIILIGAAVVQADSIQVDNTFTMTNKWLSDVNLKVTGASNGARDDQAAFGQQTLVFYGVADGTSEHGSAAQHALMTKRAAVVMAQRTLVEYLAGFALVGNTLVGDGMGQNDLVRSAVFGFVKGSQVVFQEYSPEKDSAIAIVKLGLHGPRGFASLLYNKMFSNPKLREALKCDKAPFKSETTRLDEAYDGLIIDATGQNFRPALINRIMAGKGEVLYDPAKVNQKILMEQGCGEYTDSVDKAKAALAARGVKNALLVKASGASSVADLLVTDADAVAIYSANQKGDFMLAARVAFVLK
jgi:hypothetical protein